MNHGHFANMETKIESTLFGHSFLLYLEWSTSFQQRTSAERMHTNIKLFSLTATCIFPNPCCSLAWLLVHQSVRYSPRGKIILLLIKYGAFSAVSFGVASSWPDKNIQRWHCCLPACLLLFVSVVELCCFLHGHLPSTGLFLTLFHFSGIAYLTDN